MEPLADPKKNRQIKTVRVPPGKRLESTLIFDNVSDSSELKRQAELESYQGSFEKRWAYEKMRHSQNTEKVDRDFES